MITPAGCAPLSFQFGSFHRDAAANCIADACVVRFLFHRIRVPEYHANRMIIRQIPNSVVPFGSALIHTRQYSAGRLVGS